MVTREISLVLMRKSAFIRQGEFQKVPRSSLKNLNSYQKHAASLEQSNTRETNVTTHTQINTFKLLKGRVRRYSVKNMLDSPNETTHLAHSRTAVSLLWAEVHSGSLICHVHVWLRTAGSTYKQHRIFFSIFPCSEYLRNTKQHKNSSIFLCMLVLSEAEDWTKRHLHVPMYFLLLFDLEDPIQISDFPLWTHEHDMYQDSLSKR